jgi:hypothetical protein
MRPLLALLCCIAGPLAAETDEPRCTALIALFDEVIVSRFDYRILMLEDYELAEASELRRAAEIECRTGSPVVGTEMIETALREIGVGPPMTDHAQPHD